MHFLYRYTQNKHKQNFDLDPAMLFFFNKHVDWWLSSTVPVKY